MTWFEAMQAQEANIERARARGRLIGKVLFWLVCSPLIAATVAALYLTATLPR